MSELDLRPLSLGEQLDRTLRIFRDRFGALLITTIAGLTLPMLMMANNLQRFSDFSAAARGGTRPEQMMPLVAQMLGKFALLALIFTVAIVIVRGAIAWISHKAMLGDRVDAFEAIEKGLRFFPAMLGLAIVEGVVYTVSAMVLYIPAVILLVGSVRGGGAGGALGFLVAMVAIVGVMLFLVTGFFVTGPVLVCESDATVFKSLSRSWDLTKGHRWPIIGGVLLIGVVSLVLQIGGSILFGFLAAARGTDVTAGQGPMVLAAFGVSALMSLLVTIYLYVFQMVTYYDVRIRKEAFDLEVTAERKAPAKT